MKLIKKWGLLALLSSAAFSVNVQAQQDVAAEQRQAIEKTLTPLLNGVSGPLDIRPTPIANLFLVKIGLDVIYLSGDGNYLLQGQMMDLKNGVNLTSAVVNDERKGVIAQIPPTSMLVYPANPKAPQQSTITVFTDIDCPYCRKFHNEIPALNEAGVTVRYLAFPRSGVNTPSYSKAVSVWCASNPQQAMDKVMKGETLAAKSCDNPVQAHMGYVRDLEINGTPNIILEDGALLPGYVEAQKLIPRIYN
ncbi:glutaredoxin [Thiosulfatimonas sediminis]|uniref:Thiol:disulfide interchange protein n=1 Tax=Thiosulfatimonas sediminis TaxID=2675054 RepID=A0A6F8PT74_9GAMM|nr:thioredoxin fold domain-containing protein [Thiosulfatimonas sediminis]BBP45331.1 glutaredoxin [Thiosulfatimonas sediminis]